MKKIIEIISKLQEADCEWQSFFTEQRKVIEEGASIKELYNDFINEVVKIYKTEELDFEMLKKLVNNDLAYKNIIGFVEYLLVDYIVMKPLRRIEKENMMKAKNLLFDIMENYIIRFNDKFSSGFECYSFESEEEFENVLVTMDALTDKYVEHHYTEEAVVRKFMNDTGLGEELSQYYAKLFEKGYHQIQINLLLEMMSKQNESLENLSTKED